MRGNKTRWIGCLLALCMILSLLPPAAAAEAEDSREICTCGAEPDGAGIAAHAEGCPLAAREEPAAEQPSAEAEQPSAEAEQPSAEAEQPSAEAEQPVREEEEPELPTSPALTWAPLDEASSSDMVLTVEGAWDSYAWEACAYGFWSP